MLYTKPIAYSHSHKKVADCNEYQNCSSIMKTRESEIEINN